MAICFHDYQAGPGFSGDFAPVRDFLIRINQKNIVTPGFLWGRWEWAFSLPYLDRSALGRIGIWESDGEIIALATYESNLGHVWFCRDPRLAESADLQRHMLDHARSKLAQNGCVRVCIGDTDRSLQRLAWSSGFKPTQKKECTAVLDITEASTGYSLPNAFSVTSLQDEYDLMKYNQVLWRGFNHPGEPPEDAANLESRRISLSGPDVDRHLNIAAVAPDGRFTSYCGMWHRPGLPYALVEPVATDPNFRKMGLGRAAVLEAVRRCGAQGAKQAFVGSSQQFYYQIGFYPYCTETFWESSDV